MKSVKSGNDPGAGAPVQPQPVPRAQDLLDNSIAGSLDLLVDYLVDNHVEGIHPLIMEEVEKRLIIRALERSRGNKLRAAKLLGISRNTFHKKIRKLSDPDVGTVTESEW
jgi:DNA-binding protein Fis